MHPERWARVTAVDPATQDEAEVDQETGGGEIGSRKASRKKRAFTQQ